VIKKLFASTGARNFTLNALEGALYITSGAFISAQTVLPALVSRLGGSNVAVGAISVILYGGVFLPQVFAARYVETLPWKRPWTIWGGFSQRLIVLLMGLNVLLFGGGHAGVALTLFLSLYLLNQLLGGITTPGWFDLFTKLTPLKRRGRLAGIRNSLGGGAAFLASLVLTWLLGAFAFPANYAIGFFIAFVFQMLSLVTQIYMVEEEPSPVTTRKPFFEYLQYLPGVIHGNPEFRRFLISAILLTVANMPMGFFAVYALHTFAADEGVIGQFTLSMVAIQVVSALVNGYLTDRFGNKASLLTSGAAMLLATATALLAPNLWIFRLTFVFVGINLGTELMARYNIAVEYGPAIHRSRYVALMNAVLAPWYVSALAGGYLIDLLGFRALFVVGLLFSLAGLYFLHRHVRDPRKLPPAPLPA
jgi:MFS family permease